MICDGLSQSPIDISTLQVTYDPQLPALSLNGYLSNASLQLWNFTHDGQTIVAYPPPLAALSISGANLSEAFFLEHFRLHWGYNSHQGSEHTIDGFKYPLEIQFVHRGVISNRTAILSVLFAGQLMDNAYLTEFLTLVPQIIDPSIFVQQQFDLSPLLPSMPTARFYRYDGSLTTPPCTEGVMWIVLDGKVPISARQLLVFVNNSIPVNYRPTQRLNGRPVFANFHPDTGGHTLSPGTGGGHGEGTRLSVSLPSLILLLLLL